MEKVAIEQIELQNEKLKLEIAGLKRQSPGYAVLSDMIPIITALLAIAGFIGGIWQYEAQQRAARAAEQKQKESDDTTAKANTERDRDIAEREFMKPWINSQREIYLEALNAASTAINSDEPAERKSALNRFWELYQGQMILVETTEVSGMMKKLGNQFQQSDTTNKDDLNELCRALASEMKASMATTAKLTYAEFAARQFKYTK